MTRSWSAGDLDDEQSETGVEDDKRGSGNRQKWPQGNGPRSKSCLSAFGHIDGLSTHTCLCFLVVQDDRAKIDVRRYTDLLGKFLNLAQGRVVVHVIFADRTDRL